MPEYGEVVSSVPRLAPSSLNCTPTTPTLSEAVAARETEPLMVEPVVGEVIEIVGVVVSTGGGVVPPPVTPPVPAAGFGIPEAVNGYGYVKAV